MKYTDIPFAIPTLYCLSKTNIPFNLYTDISRKNVIEFQCLDNGDSPSPQPIGVKLLNQVSKSQIYRFVAATLSHKISAPFLGKRHFKGYKFRWLVTFTRRQKFIEN